MDREGREVGVGNGIRVIEGSLGFVFGDKGGIYCVYVCLRSMKVWVVHIASACYGSRVTVEKK